MVGLCVKEHHVCVRIQSPFILKGREESQTLLGSHQPAGEQVNFFGLQALTGESNGTPLQYSCLENPMDGGAW